MALFWCTEALPLAVTALFPVVLFPMMGIMDSTACSQYLKDTNMLFIGGLLVAITVEKWNLHKRIALRVLLLVGVKPALLLLGFMVVTAFLSMWISNTATTAMMIPIAQAVLEQLHTSEEKLQECPSAFENVNQKENQINGCTKLTFEDKVTKESNAEDSRKQKHLKLCKGMSLCVCYSASIGGIATLTGTTPNLVMKGQMDQLFPGNNNVINFASWFGFAFPTMLLLLALAWIWLQIMFLGTKFKKNFGCGGKPEQKAKEKRAYQVIFEEHKKLGSMTFAEICVLVLFTLLVILWFTRDPGFMPGWATISFNKDGKEYVTDATVAVFVALMLFLFPSEFPSYLILGKKLYKYFVPRLSWTGKTVNQKIDILSGTLSSCWEGGFALAKRAARNRDWRVGLEISSLLCRVFPQLRLRSFVLCLLVAIFGSQMCTVM
ncbi:unnamed protein product [Staurois parvus]|uniref:Solute carrier family 13 member 2 n=1 Tax=Staurois parvus TaxID=386267 RepID=A0ABN9H294_9NEOB|nr:unnamed protein product [Staurois parvus]